ncbi:hypothetical protein GGI59_006360 [Rhizobium lentis]|uniref:Uncharacterized protein n=1 Tax=Rhizobium lentis TaxID=1138194 RepID=A0A7W8XKR9_9HYPH|nr:hypothetical protein [Rhizobium lentis]MBB5554102.1 hypothetical protein [Rhizobium lentis]MBB5564651.1 hypothetical protein [Rhizobium lentis]MBB5571167.1 hypothetical protein [Rhizobium lentis]
MFGVRTGHKKSLGLSTIEGNFDGSVAKRDHGHHTLSCLRFAMYGKGIGSDRDLLKIARANWPSTVGLL